ncbi:hypothetical protein EGT07_11480 [Herbaspirillum sp. HC18]|nr:hypothetical protein EGT07_11480 [Herbaspirillum sp. HC18]
MKRFSLIIAAVILAGCSSMGTSSNMSSGASAGGGDSCTSKYGARAQVCMNRHDDPRDIYFGG